MTGRNRGELREKTDWVLRDVTAVIPGFWRWNGCKRRRGNGFQRRGNEVCGFTFAGFWD